MVAATRLHIKGEQWEGEAKAKGVLARLVRETLWECAWVLRESSKVPESVGKDQTGQIACGRREMFCRWRKKRKGG